jgi:hypothetical protein
MITYMNGLGLDIEFSADNLAWHYPWVSGDMYIRFSDDFGTSWTDGIYLNYSAVLDDYVQKETGSRLITSEEITKLESLTGSEGAVYEITLPADTTVAGRVLNATEGTDYPTGWVLEAGDNAANLDITHSLGMRPATVNVFYNVSGTEFRQLINFNNAYSGIVTQDDDSVRIEALATIQKEIKIYIVFV